MNIEVKYDPIVHEAEIAFLFKVYSDELRDLTYILRFTFVKSGSFDPSILAYEKLWESFDTSLSAKYPWEKIGAVITIIAIIVVIVYYAITSGMISPILWDKLSNIFQKYFPSLVS